MTEMKNLVMSVIDGTVQKKGSKHDSKIQSDLSAFSEDINKLIGSDIKDQSSEVTFCFVLKTTFFATTISKILCLFIIIYKCLLEL